MTQAFNLSQFANKVNTSGQADLTTAVTGTLPVANGGTNQTTYTDGQLLIGNTTGNTLTKATLTAGTGISVTNGSGAITIASTASGANIQSQIFTAPGTWTCPASTTQVRVAVFGGSSGAIWNSNGGAGGTSSFGSVISATGGGAGNNNNGSGTVSSGTTLKTGNLVSLSSSLSTISLITAPGTGNSVPSAPTAYSTTSGFFAGSGPAVAAPQRGSSGGFAVGIVPVSAPVSVTVGAGGTAPPPSGNAGGIGGAVVVEWVA